MHLFLRILAAILTFVQFVVNGLLNIYLSKRKPTYPPINNPLLFKSITSLTKEIRTRKLKCTELVQVYIDRIKAVDAKLNAVVEDRFDEALKEAKHADEMIEKTPDDRLSHLFSQYPLLGLPFTVKESCGLKGLSFCVGSVHRKKEKCMEDGDAVSLLRAAGCIPLLVSANPEFCLSFETNTHTHGRCLNPYDMCRTTGGSSGGEGALNGAGASLFGVTSDIAGSIRLPALYCGVYGHKPTGGLVSVKGHFPHSDDRRFGEFLQIGPMSRFAKDLPILLQIMAGKNANKLRFNDGIQSKHIKIYYAFGFSGLCGFVHPSIPFDMKMAMLRAIKCFENGGLPVKEVDIKGFKNVIEMTLCSITSITGTPSIITQSAKHKPTIRVLVSEFFRALIGRSLYTKEAVFMELMHRLNGFIPEHKSKIYQNQLKELKSELLELLDNNGVLFFPTCHTSAVPFHTSILNMGSHDMLTIFNALGFPATHVPMGLDSHGLPIGFQIIAAPYQDKLCLQIAAELELIFGGWVSPLNIESMD